MIMLSGLFFAAPHCNRISNNTGGAAKAPLAITSVLLLAFFLAGCFGTGGNPSGQLVDDPLGTGVFTGDLGIIDGYVITDGANIFAAPSRSFKSISSAKVTIIESGVFTFTDDNGYYKFTGIKPGKVNVTVRGNDVNGFNYFNRITAEVLANKSVLLQNIVLKKASKASGRIVTDDGGSPAGTTISVEGFPYFTLADTNGDFTLDSVPSDENIGFRVSKSGYSERSLGPINIVAGSSFSFTQNIPISRIQTATCVLSGKVYDSNVKKGISGAAVMVYETAGTGRTLTRTAYANSEGKYSVTLDQNKSYTVAFSRPNYYTKDYSFQASGSAASLDAYLVLANLNGKYYAINGIVRDATGATPIAGARIFSYPSSDFFTTGDDGSFSVSLPQGNFMLYASRAGYSDSTVEIIAQPYVDVTTEVSIKMVSNPSLALVGVSGTVLDLSSNTVANVQVSVDKYGLYTYTNPSGAFLFYIPDGVYNISATTDGVYFGYSNFSISGVSPPPLTVKINQSR